MNTRINNIKDDIKCLTDFDDDWDNVSMSVHTVLGFKYVVTKDGNTVSIDKLDIDTGNHWFIGTFIFEKVGKVEKLFHKRSPITDRSNNYKFTRIQ